MENIEKTQEEKLNKQESNSRKKVKKIDFQESLKRGFYGGLIGGFIAVVFLLCGRLIASVAAKEYIGVYKCYYCDRSFYAWEDYCGGCGREYDDNVLVRVKPHCSVCGKRTQHFARDFCDNCGGRLIDNEYVHIYEIENGFVRFCAKRL